MSTISKLDPLWGMAGTLAVAYALDRWIHSLRETGFQSFNMTAHLWGAWAANVLIGALLFWLAWYAVFQHRLNRLIAALFVLTGLGLTFLPVFIASLPAAFAFLYSPELRGLRITLLYSAPNSRLLFSSAFITAIGLYGLLPLNRELLRRIMGRFW